MIEPRRELRTQSEMLGPKFLRDLLQCFQMCRRITIPKRMIGDEVEATLKEGAQ